MTKTVQALAGLRTIACGLVMALTLALLGRPAAAQDPLEITVAGGQFAPIPIAVSSFEAAGPELGPLAARIVDVIERDLGGSGLFDVVPRSAFVSGPAPFGAVPQFADWRTINADALVTGRVQRAGDGRVEVQFRVYDTEAEQQLEGLQFLAPEEDWRRIAHKTADAIYSELTGEGPYFDSRVAFIDETGSKGNRVKRLALMDQDGANVRYLGPEGLVLTPRFSPDGRSVLYTSWDTGSPQVFLLDLQTGQRERLGNFPGMSFAPRFSPSGREIVFSITEGGNADLYMMSLASRSVRRLTNNPAIDTSASFSPDGSQLVFESDRGGTQQLYVMPAGGGEARRISFGSGNYGTPVWSPRGDLIAFTKILGGRFHIGVMRTDGSDERLLSSSFLDEGPTWAPNGRVLMFFRQSPGQAGRSQLMSVDVTGRNLQVVETPNLASDPAWSPLRE